MRSGWIAAGLFTLVGAASAAAASFVGAPSDIQPRTYRHSPPRSGEELSELCHVLTEHYAGLGKTTSEMCTISLPGAGDFRRPSWQAISPAENLDIVKEGFFWQFVGQQVNFSHFYNPEHQKFIERLRREWGASKYTFLRIAAPKEIDPAVIDDAWELFGGPARAMIDAGVLRLETAPFDLNFDGTVDTVYRMTDLTFHIPQRPSDPIAIGAEIWHCETGAGRVEDHPYVIFVRSRDAAQISNGGEQSWAYGTRSEIGHLNDVFWYRGRPYVAWIERHYPGFVVSEPNPGPRHGNDPQPHGFMYDDICQMSGPPN